MTLKWPKFLTFKRTLMIFLAVILLIVVLIYNFGGFRPASPLYDAEEFSTDGFLQYVDFTAADRQPKVMTSGNGRFVMNFNPIDTTFAITDSLTGTVWNSNPVGEDDFTNIIDATKKYQKSTMVVNYVTLKGAISSFNTYNLSVISIPEENIEPSFSVKYDAAGRKITVLYELYKKGIDYTYFPYKLTVERMEEIIAKNKEIAVQDPSKLLSPTDITMLKNGYYKLDKTDPAKPFYYLYSKSGTYESVSKIYRDSLYDYMYKRSGYTREDVVYDNSLFNIVIDMDRPHFTVGIEYTLTDDGLKVTLPANSIKEQGSFQIASIEILPYMTTAKRGNEGYMVIPDGSGAVMNFDNDKLEYGAYSKRVFGQDSSYFEEIRTTAVEDVLLPMYGLINKTNQTGVMVTADKGEAMLNLVADISNRIDSYNKIVYQAYLREPQMITIGTGYAALRHIKWTEDRAMNDVVLNYHFLTADQADYSAMAKLYREYLGLQPKDETDDTVLNLELIGSYDFKTNFMGIGYTAYDSLTTYEEATKILDQMIGEGYNDINVIYRGWQDEGLHDTSISKLSLSKKMGGKNALDKFISYTESKGIDFYPYVSFSEFTDFNETFGKQHYSARTVGNDFSFRYPYNLSWNIFDTTKDRIMIVSPKFYVTYMEKFTKQFNKKVGINSVTFGQLGSSLGGDYKKNALFYKESALKEQVKSLQLAKENGLTDLNLFAPYQYAFNYVSNAIEVPYTSTSYEIIDYSIPFYQLVISGVFDYSGLSYNANDEKGLTWHLMHMIETGSNVQFTFTYEDSEKLMLTDYNNYYFTQYEKWLQDVRDLMDTLNGLGIHQGELVSHVQLEPGVFEVKYSNGVEILLNYTENAKEIDGLVIPENSYLKK